MDFSVKADSCEEIFHILIGKYGIAHIDSLLLEYKKKTLLYLQGTGTIQVEVEAPIQAETLVKEVQNQECILVEAPIPTEKQKLAVKKAKKQPEINVSKIDENENETKNVLILPSPVQEVEVNHIAEPQYARPPEVQNPTHLRASVPNSEVNTKQSIVAEDDPLYDLTTISENPIVPISVPNSDTKNLDKKKHYELVLQKKKELEEKGIKPESLLTKENLEKWIKTQSYSYARIARETGCLDTVVSREATKHGFKSDISKFIIGKKYTKH